MNFCDYLNWRGDIPLDAVPVGEVDNAILSYTVILDYSGIVPADDTRVPIGDVVAAYTAKYGEEGKYMGAVIPDQTWPMIRQMAKTERFGHITFSGFVNRVIAENSEQFAAMVVSLRDDLHYIAIRGTDDTLAAWKENCLMAVEDAVPARQDASRYLSWAAETYPGTLLIGGHSKGGNLAVWAAACADPAIQDRIETVYSHDGPGFKKEFYTEEGFARIEDKVHVLMPQYSIVGTFFHQKNKEIVKSNVKGIFAHDCFNWEVLGSRFVRRSELAESSRAFDNAFDEALDQMDNKTRKDFINDLFDTLSCGGAFSTLTDFKTIKAKQVLEMLNTLRTNSEFKKLIKNIVTVMIREMDDDKKAQ